MNVDGSDVQRRTENTIADAAPEWSPDGSRIVHFRGERDPRDERRRLEPAELVPGSGSVGPQWSPDLAESCSTATTDRAPAPHPYAVNADGSELVQLGPTIPSSQAPSWSPDGTKIVFLSAGPVGSDIWIMNADGTGAAPILDDALIRSGPRWQPVPRAPTALTQPATDLTTLTAKLNGTIDTTVLHPSTYWFEYGMTTAYGARTADAGAPAPVGPQSVFADLTGLQPATEYHVRLLARNAIGTTAGGDATFRTPKARPRSLTVRVTPRRDRRLPFRYVFRGRLRLPTSVPASRGCGGRVTIQLRRGKRKVATRRARLSRSCRYRKVVSFRSTRRLRASKGRLRVTTTFRGNAVLSSKRGAQRVVRLG